MREHPMLCTDDVVRAILAGRQTQDRRPVTIGTCVAADADRRLSRSDWEHLDLDNATLYGGRLHACRPPLTSVDIVRPRLEAGDLLYCRETLRRFDSHPCGEPIVTYATDGTPAMDLYTPIRWPWDRPVRQSIHMDRLFARLWLRVKWVRIERLQAIDEAGCRAEGCDGLESFADLWNGLYEAKGAAWKTNPWVVSCGFSVASRTGRAGVGDGS